MRKVCIGILMMGVFVLQAQEHISVLESNPLLKTNQKQVQKMRTSSAVALPFLDDFSYNSYFPDNLLWEDSAVFVNRSYPINPVTIGVATFDGLDANGMAYDISASTQAQRADSLTSRAIDLSAVDSAYLLFYYQAEGLGDNPQTEDSLVLEFLSGIDPLGFPIWQHIWSIAGHSTQEFQRMEFNIKGVNYLHASFQFRFRNYATLSGNFDHWHIDYVKVDEYSTGQIPNLNDVAFVYENPQLLKRYREMPWVQYQENTAGELRDTLDIILRNNNAGLSVDYKYDVFESSSQVEHYPYLGNLSSTRNVQISVYDSIGNFEFVQPPVFLSDTIFKSGTTDSATFLFKNVIKTAPSDNKNNDTLTHFQKFNSHFAYDDGVAEFAYGINVQGAKMAYQFHLNKADSLRIIQIYFAPMQNNVSNIPFHLVVWEDNNGVPGNVLLKSNFVYPVYEDRVKFHNYYLDSIIGLDGTFYVGIEQTTNDMLNVGLDRNSPSNNYMFYNVGGGWNYSQFPGAWMIRPVLRTTPIISSTNSVIIQNEIKIFPNPFFNFTTVLLNNETKNIIQLFDISGRLLRKNVTTENRFQLFRNNLKSGIYLLQIQNKKGVFRKKLVIE
ncbi:MAG: T9SS type A sorting domain-containing protein [Flavobacteriales bacterium]|nr:T9SS type A sorting domain-containing protein [Flavobacteriales bacterium]